MTVKVSLLVLTGAAACAYGQQIPDRATLNAILGGGGTTDDFEAYSIGDGAADSWDVLSLDENAIINGQGPGLVNDGATYSSPSQMQWNGNAYFGLSSKTLNGTAPVSFTYDTFTTAMGVDLAAFEGFGDNSLINVYDTDGILVFNTAVNLPGDASDVFFGYQHASGLGRVEFYGEAFPFTANFDDHTYGVPTPGSAALLGLGALAARRRR